MSHHTINTSSDLSEDSYTPSRSKTTTNPPRPVTMPPNLPGQSNTTVGHGRVQTFVTRPFAPRRVMMGRGRGLRDDLFIVPAPSSPYKPTAIHHDEDLSTNYSTPLSTASASINDADRGLPVPNPEPPTTASSIVDAAEHGRTNDMVAEAERFGPPSRGDSPQVYGMRGKLCPPEAEDSETSIPIQVPHVAERGLGATTNATGAGTPEQTRLEDRPISRGQFSGSSGGATLNDENFSPADTLAIMAFLSKVMEPHTQEDPHIRSDLERPRQFGTAAKYARQNLAAEEKPRQPWAIEAKTPKPQAIRVSEPRPLKQSPDYAHMSQVGRQQLLGRRLPVLVIGKQISPRVVEESAEIFFAHDPSQARRQRGPGIRRRERESPGIEQVTPQQSRGRGHLEGPLTGRSPQSPPSPAPIVPGPRQTRSNALCSVELSGIPLFTEIIEVCDFIGPCGKIRSIQCSGEDPCLWGSYKRYEVVFTEVAGAHRLMERFDPTDLFLDDSRIQALPGFTSIDMYPPVSLDHSRVLLVSYLDLQLDFMAVLAECKRMEGSTHLVGYCISSHTTDTRVVWDLQFSSIESAERWKDLMELHVAHDLDIVFGVDPCDTADQRFRLADNGRKLIRLP